MTTDGDHWYSHNRQYRCNRETLDIQRHRGKGRWSEITDRERHQIIPKKILEDFDKAATVKSAVFEMASVRRIGVSESGSEVAT